VELRVHLILFWGKFLNPTLQQTSHGHID